MVFLFCRTYNEKHTFYKEEFYMTVVELEEVPEGVVIITDDLIITGVTEDEGEL
jgi:hypothetical protein